MNYYTSLAYYPLTDCPVVYTANALNYYSNAAVDFGANVVGGLHNTGHQLASDAAYVTGQTLGTVGWMAGRTVHGAGHVVGEAAHGLGHIGSAVHSVGSAVTHGLAGFAASAVDGAHHGAHHFSRHGF